jgi:hypothetical protein
MAIAVLALGFLPLANWIPGGAQDPAYARRWTEWTYGGLICLGAAIIGALVAGRLTPRLQDIGAELLRGIRSWLGDSPRRADLLVAIACLAAYLFTARTVLDAKPLLIDEIVQVLQGRMYASGDLFTPVDAERAFFSILHVVDIGDRVYSQFPPGWPAMLAIASLFRAEWLAGPLCGAVAVFVFARLLRSVVGSTSPLTVTLGALTFGLAPFSVAQFASHMSHGPAVMWLLLAMLGLSRVAREAETSRWLALATGVAAGCAFAVRPLDAVAFLAPAAMWLLWRSRLGARERAVAALAAVGLALPIALVMWVNLETTGHATQFGYSALWGSAHGLGFHDAPWGDAHTPQRGVELLSLYMTRLNSYLFESPFPSLLPAIVALFSVRPFSAIERFIAGATVVHALLYFAYWHDGFYLGPRFVFPWVPLLVLLCVRLGARLTEIPFSIRVRGAQYRSGLTSMRTDYSAEARRAGVTNSLVFVRESWGAQLVARLWALGVSRPAASTLYSKVDACILDHAITRLERGAVRRDEAEALLQPLLADSARVRASNVSPDTTERMLPGSIYDAECSARVNADRDGYALLPPFLLDRESGNVYVRDLGARDSILVKRFQGRRAVVVSRDGVDGQSALVWTPIQQSASRPD